jgi:hypothetical protein
MAAPAGKRAFALLFREFFSQLFTTESSLTERQLRQAMIGVFVFVITPGFFLPLQLGAPMEFASLQNPALLDALTRLLAAIFLAYSMVAIGVIAAFEWDALAFDRRDAMVLGSLPVSGRTVVAAKASALGAVLLIAAAGINGLTAATFSLVATSHASVMTTARLFVSHLVATTAASAFIFCTLVTVRSSLGLFGRGRVVIGSLLQFALISALLCFLVFAPTAVRLEFPRRGAAIRTIGVHLQSIPAWSPTKWFAALYNLLRGAASATEVQQARVAVVVTFGSALAAVAATLAGYRHQLRLALAPAASTGIVAAARLPRALARVLAGGSRPAQAIADFVVTTLARSRAQQAPIAMNAAIAVVMIVLDIYRTRGEADAVVHLSAAWSPLPLMAAFWIAVGVRASFFVPSELPAAWTFRINAIDAPGARHAAIRAAMFAMLVPVAVVCAVVLCADLSWWDMVRQAAIVALAVMLLIELLAWTVTFVPYTRLYEPGHARLKTRWPLYPIGAYAFSNRFVAFERVCWAHPWSFAALLIGLAASVIALDVAARRRADPHSADVALEGLTNEEPLAGLGLGLVTPHIGSGG